MDKKEMVRQLLKKGVLVSPEALSRINTEPPELPTHQTERFEIKTTTTAERERVSVKDFTEHYNNKYTEIKNMLSRKAEAVSINKLGSIFSEVSVIGMIKEMTPQGFVLEDQTGEIEIIPKEKVGLEVNDVVAVRGIIRESRLFCNEIILPDIPLTHEVRTMDAALAANHNEIVLKTEAGKRTAPLKESPLRATLYKGNRELDLLVCKPDKEPTPKEAVHILKKRQLPENGMSLNHNIISKIPDMLLLLSNKNWIESYKGVTIISCAKDSIVVVNLRTRQAEFRKI